MTTLVLLADAVWALVDAVDRLAEAVSSRRPPRAKRVRSTHGARRPGAARIEP